jgi:hypothetical protein
MCGEITYSGEIPPEAIRRVVWSPLPMLETTGWRTLDVLGSDGIYNAYIPRRSHDPDHAFPEQ